MLQLATRICCSLKREGRWEEGAWVWMGGAAEAVRSVGLSGRRIGCFRPPNFAGRRREEEVVVLVVLEQEQEQEQAQEQEEARALALALPWARALRSA
jgi:hypothetical protein